jgi:hypothetical protein
MGLTEDRNDPRLGYGVDEEPGPQNEAYLVLSEEERAKGFVRPLRTAYVHDTCGATTTMNIAIAETYARDPKFYGATYCTRCQKHLPVSEFRWYDDQEGYTDQRVGS